MASAWTRVILSSFVGSVVAAASLVALDRAVSVANAAPLEEAPIASVTSMMATQRVLSYPFEQVWPTAIRYLRVDRGYEIIDRDQESGYVLFEFIADGKRGNGSLEMFATQDSSGRPSVSVSATASAGPVHLPNTILEGLAAKVREERGQPAPPPPKDDKPKSPEPPKDDEDPPDDGSVPLLPPAQDPG